VVQTFESSGRKPPHGFDWAGAFPANGVQKNPFFWRRRMQHSRMTVYHLSPEIVPNDPAIFWVPASRPFFFPLLDGTITVETPAPRSSCISDS
jgi:hypothetical protein